MVYKTPFLKKSYIRDYDPSADETHTWELTDNALAAVWIGIKGDLVQADLSDNTLMSLITSLDITMGGFSVVHYINTISAVVMNMLLKGSRYMLIGNGQAIDDIREVYFPILFGAPYLNDKMCLPKSLDNRKYLTLGLDIATANFDDLLIDITEVIMPDAKPLGFIKQEEHQQSAPGTGDHDIWLQTNWDLLKLLLKSTTAPDDDAYTSTIERAGLEIDDFMYGYSDVPWECLHAELMDEMPGMAGIEDHFHADPSSGNTGHPEDLEKWIRNYGVMDFFFNYDLKWKAPISGASTAKLKYNCGVDEAFYWTEANYVLNSKFERI